MIDLSDLTTQAMAATAAQERRLRGIADDPDTLPRAKALALAQHRRMYEATVGSLKHKADERIEAERGNLRVAHAAEVERLRAVVGDVVLLRIYERRIERMSEAQRRAALAEAADGWEREVMRLLCDFPETTPEAAALAAAEKLMHVFTPSPWPVKWPGR